MGRKHFFEFLQVSLVTLTFNLVNPKSKKHFWYRFGPFW